jgi:hypothetical protein
MDLYFAFNKKRFKSRTEKVLFAVSRLEGEALDWIEGFLGDYIREKDDIGSINVDMRQETQIIFDNYNNFVKKLKATFRVVDEEAQAERVLESLK